jgi:hypothetical protein
MSRPTIYGTLSILALVIAARWFAGDAEISRWSASPADSAGRRGAPEASVVRLEWSADGRSMLCHFRGLVEGESSLAVLPLVPAGRRMPVYVADQPIVDAALAPDGLHILVATARGELSWIETDSFAIVMLLRLPPMIDFTELVVFDDNLAAAGTGRGSIYLADPGRQTVSELTIGSGPSICSLQFSRDGRRLVAGSGDGTIAAWDLHSGTRLQSFEGHAHSSVLARFLPDGQRVMSAGLDDTVRIWTFAGGREEWQRECGLTGVRALDVSPDGTTAAWVGHDRKVVVWDLERRRKKFEFATNAPLMSTVRFSPRGTALAAAGGEPVVYLYDIETGSEHTIALREAIEFRTP